MRIKVDLSKYCYSPVLASLIEPLHRDRKIRDIIYTDEINVSLCLLDDPVEILYEAYSISIN